MQLQARKPPRPVFWREGSSYIDAKLLGWPCRALRLWGICAFL